MLFTTMGGGLGRYRKFQAVRFPNNDGSGKEQLEFGGDEVRVHIDWIDRKWILARGTVEV